MSAGASAAGLEAPALRRAGCPPLRGRVWAVALKCFVSSAHYGRGVGHWRSKCGGCMKKICPNFPLCNFAPALKPDPMPGIAITITITALDNARGLRQAYSRGNTACIEADNRRCRTQTQGTRKTHCIYHHCPGRSRRGRDLVMAEESASDHRPDGESGAP